MSYGDSWFRDDCVCALKDESGDGCSGTASIYEPTHLCGHCRTHAMSEGRNGREDEAYAAGRLAGYEEGSAAATYATEMLRAWRETKDFLRDRLLTSGRSDVSINAVLRVMNEALDESVTAEGDKP